MLSDEVLRVENLHVGYKTHRGLAKVLDKVNLSMKRGEKIGLIGESGSGKTTLLSSILRVLAPNAVITSGSIFIEGVNVLKCKKEVLERIRREKVGIIFQDPMSALNPFYKVRDHFYYALKYSNAGKTFLNTMQRKLASSCSRR